MKYDPFEVFPVRKTIGQHESGWSKIEEDTEYTFRAMVFYSWGPGHAESMFPPAQLVSTDNKYDFHRELLKYKTQLQANGNRIIKTTILQGGRKMYEQEERT